MSIVSKLQKADDLQPFLDGNKQHLIVLYFTANWSDECKLVNNVFGELSKDPKYANSLKVLEIEAEEFEDVSLNYGIESVPTFVFIKDRHMVHQSSGADVVQLRKKIDEVLVMTNTSVNGAEKTADLNARLKKLIESAPVMLFMVGTPQEPRCGFSKQILEIFKSKNVKFASFDVLSDDAVCEGLKKYSNWPTYPQLYINSELIGGLDIVKELVANGEFDALLPKKDEALNERLKKLINQAKVVLFMKGNSKEPKCGFSRQAIELLNNANVKYETFDILTDEEVRQGLKEYSKWPTYPQLYVDGELIGGLDIMKELKETGELSDTLKGK